MWVYKRLSGDINSEKWEVGFYAPSGTWIQESVHIAREDAAVRVHYLNGGGQVGGMPRRVAEQS